jgi:molybdopterin molybdotransferase
LIQPGQPVVFGSIPGGAGAKFFFGLPGNPSSTMVTFEIFARAALELLSGQDEVWLHMPFARLTHDFRHRMGITRFRPARLSPDGTWVTPIDWRGSGDIPSLTRANVFLVTDPERAEYPRGEYIRVLYK